MSLSNITLSTGFIEKVESFARHDSIPLDSKLERLKSEGFLLEPNIIPLLSLIDGRVVESVYGNRVEFDVLHGLGTLDDIYHFDTIRSLSPFPIGTWSAYTILIDKNGDIYLTDFDRLALIKGKTETGIMSIVNGPSAKDMIFL